MTSTSNDSTQLENLAQRHGFSPDAVKLMFQAVQRGNGNMAQFSHPDFGGSGQWMRGGMTMVSDMFNHALKARVDALCQDLSTLVSDQPKQSDSDASASPASTSTPNSPATKKSSGNWWPDELGSPGASGSQNDMRYAYFPDTQRLAIDNEGKVSIYDTLDHRIGGVSQQQSSGSSLVFTSQHGPIKLEDLPLVGAGSPRR